MISTYSTLAAAANSAGLHNHQSASDRTDRMTVLQLTRRCLDTAAVLISTSPTSGNTPATHIIAPGELPQHAQISTLPSDAHHVSE